MCLVCGLTRTLPRIPKVRGHAHSGGRQPTLWGGGGTVPVLRQGVMPGTTPLAASDQHLTLNGNLLGRAWVPWRCPRMVVEDTT